MIFMTVSYLETSCVEQVVRDRDKSSYASVILILGAVISAIYGMYVGTLAINSTDVERRQTALGLAGGAALITILLLLVA